MANRDPNTPPKDHTVAIIGGVVACCALGVGLLVGLEWTKSPNTMAILGLLAAGIAAVGRVLMINVKATRQGVQLAAAAAATADDTHKRTQDIQHQLKGNLTQQFSALHARLDSIEARITEIDRSIDARARAAVTAVNANPEREQYFDNRMRGLIDTALDRREAMCKVPQTRRRR